MAILSKVQVGQKITADMFNNIIDAIRECQINSVVGSGGTIATFKRGPGGTTVSINSRRTGQVSSQVCPFDPTVTVVTSGFQVSFSAGTINGLLPTNMFSPLTGVTTASVNYFYIKCTSDGKLLTSAVIEKDTSVRTPQASNADTAPTTLNVLIAYMTTAGIAVKTIPCSNLNARVFPTIQEDNVTYVAGERNFKQYYNWGF
jgi:hypothetical protein